VPAGVPFDGYDAGDVGPAIGDSFAVECVGLGATVLPAAPALWRAVGVDAAGAREIFDRLGEIALARHPHYRVAALQDAGAPTGIDVVRVVQTSIRPVIDIAMTHREPGGGMVGFGLTSPPLACFASAALAVRERRA
jgi:hypothetical protein